MKNVKVKVLVCLIIALFLCLSFGMAYSYFISNSNVNGSGNTIDGQTRLSDLLSYSASKPISLYASLESFSMGNGNIKDGTELIVTLTSNLADYAKYTYDVYLEISENSFLYSTSEKTPEILLKVTDPAGMEVKEIEGLNYVNINGESGFDITEERDFVFISSDYIIETGDVINQEWKIELILLNLDENQIDNSGKTFDANLVVRNEKRNEYTMYSWNGLPLLSTNIDITIEKLKELEVTSLYHSFNVSWFTNGNVARVISKLKENNIDVYWLTGDGSWYNRPDTIKQKIDLLYNYNVKNPENKIKGIVLDIEWYISSYNIERTPANLEIFANTMEEIYDYAKKKGILFVNSIYWGYNSSSFCTEKVNCSNDDRNNVDASFRKIIKNCDRVSVMNYVKPYAMTRLREEIAIAREYNKQIETTLDFGRPRLDSNESKISTLEYCSDSDYCPIDELSKFFKPGSSTFSPIDYAKYLWGKVYNYQNDEGYDNRYYKLAYSYHYLNQALFVVGSYDRVRFKMTLNNEDITNKNLFVKFDNGDMIEMKTDGDIYLPKNKNYNFYLNGYNILSEKREISEDKTMLYTLDFGQASKYSLEMYPKVYNEETGTYKGVGNGTITLTNLLTNEQIIRGVSTINGDNLATSGGYKILENTEYAVTYTDIDGKNYILDNVTAKNQNGEEIVLYNKNKNLFIPLNFKENLKIYPKLYFSKAK